MEFYVTPYRESGGEEWIRTIEGISQQIYSLPRLATSVPLQQGLS